MTNRFTESARRVVAAAEEEARKHKNFYVGTEHLLLGLLADRDDAVTGALESLDVGVGAVRAQVEQSIKAGQQTPSGPIPLTPRAESVIELAVQEASLAGQREVDSVHILVGLIKEGQGVAAQALIDGGAELASARRAVLRVRGEGQQQTEDLAGQISAAVQGHWSDLTEAASNGDLAPVIGRDREIERLIEVLSQYFARNPMLVCEPETAEVSGGVQGVPPTTPPAHHPGQHSRVGIGRVEVAGLAQQIAAGLVPAPLQGKSLAAVDLEALAAGLPAGPEDEVISAAAAEIRGLADIIFCTDDLLRLTARPAAILRALLADRRVKLIGVTLRRRGESGEYGAFERFEPIQVTEPTTLYDIGQLKLDLEAARYFGV